MSKWPVKELGDLCTIRTGKKDVNSGNPDGEYPFFTCAKNHTFSDEYSFDTEALLIAGNGDVGHVQRYSGKFEAYQRTYVLSDFEHVSMDFVYRVLDGKLRQALVGQKLGNTMPYIKVGMLTNFPIPVPPLAEQERIVAILDEAFEGLATATAHTERKLQNARDLFQSTLQSTFQQKGNDWTETTLDKVCNKFQYGSSSKSNTEGDVPVLRMGNLQDQGIDWDSLKYSSDKTEIAKYSLVKDDVLFNRTNSPELVGKSVIYDGSRPALHAGYLIRVQVDKTKLDPFYLNYFLNYPGTRDHGFSVMSSSVNQANINATKLKAYKLPLPPLPEQRAIVEKLDELSAQTHQLESLYQRQLDAYTELKQSLLHQAFSGKL